MQPRVNEAPENLSRRVYRLLKADIIDCRVMPGEAVYEGSLAAKFGVSKTPIREALQRLSDEGWMTIQARRGYIASQVSVRDVQEITQLRLLIEPKAAFLAATNAKSSHLRAIQELLDTTVSTNRDAHQHAAFHVAVAAASGNRRLCASLERLHEETTRVFNLLDRLHPVAKLDSAHRSIAEAILRGDAELAEKLSAKNLLDSRAAVIQALLELGDGPSVDMSLVLSS